MVNQNCRLIIIIKRTLTIGPIEFVSVHKLCNVLKNEQLCFIIEFKTDKSPAAIFFGRLQKHSTKSVPLGSPTKVQIVRGRYYHTRKTSGPYKYQYI